MRPRRRQGFAEQYREVVHKDREDRVEGGRADDGAGIFFRVGKSLKSVLEAKRPAVDSNKGPSHVPATCSAAATVICP
jgi:hypothetical protein